jgi:hypothetical protein
MYIALNYDRGLGGTRNNWLNCPTCKDNRHTDVWNYTRKIPKTVARTTNQAFREWLNTNDRPQNLQEIRFNPKGRQVPQIR